MMLISKSLPFLTTILSTIITLSRCGSVSASFEEISIIRYQKFVKDGDENPGDEPKCSLALVKSLDEIIKSYMPDRKVMCILVAEKAENNCFADNTLEGLLKLGTKSVIIMKNHSRAVEEEVIFQKPDVYILLGIELSAKLIKNLKDFGKIGSTWNPRGLYISIARSKDEAASQMTNLWFRLVYKVIVLVHSEKNSDVVEAYTWRPYHPPTNCGPPTVETVIKLGEFIEELEEFEKESDIDPGMIPQNFGNCPLNVSFNIWPPFVDDTTTDRNENTENRGIEVNLVEMICKKIGFEVKPDYHPLTLVRGEGEAWAGSIVPRNTYFKDYDIATPYLQDSLVWNVPVKIEIRSVGLDNGLSPTLLAPSFSAIFLIAVLLRVARVRHWFLLVWGSLWEQFDHKLPLQLRGVWGCWLLLCLHLTLAYRTTMVSNLAEPWILNGPQSQSDLVSAGLKLGFLDGAVAFFSEDDEVQQWILKHYVSCETVDECYKEIPAGRAVFTDKWHADYLDLQTPETSDLPAQVRQLPPSLVYKLAMLYKKGHAALESFDRVCHHAQQAGLVQYLINNVLCAQTNIRMHKLNSHSIKERSLSFPQIRKGFQLLVGGLTFATLSFIYETLHELFRVKCPSCLKRMRRLCTARN